MTSGLPTRVLIDLAAFVLFGLPAAGCPVFAVGGVPGLVAALAMPLWMLELSAAAARRQP